MDPRKTFHVGARLEWGPSDDLRDARGQVSISESRVSGDERWDGGRVLGVRQHVGTNISWGRSVVVGELVIRRYESNPTFLGKWNFLPS